jgi:hypothetical protein
MDHDPFQGGELALCFWIILEQKTWVLTIYYEQCFWKFEKYLQNFIYKIWIEPNFHNMFVCVYTMHNLLKYKQMHTIDLELEKIYNKPNICLQYVMNKDTMALKTKKIKKSPLSKNNHVLRIIMKYWELKFEVYFFTSLALNWNPLQVYYQILPYIIIIPRVFSF